jgi:hypothetical protein
LDLEDTQLGGSESGLIDNDQDGFSAEEDCDDNDPLTNPDTPEVCDGIDNDCDGEIDADPVNGETYYEDADGDGFGLADTSIEACEIQEGWSTTSGDCDDRNPLVYPGGVEVCDGLDNNCSGNTDEEACENCLQVPYKGHTYQFCSSRLSWPDARDQCDEWGYSLITINNEEEDDFASEILSENELGDTWIGYNDRGESNEDDFSWTGPPGSEYENWYANEPNNYGGNEDCVEKREDFGWQWNDRACDQAIPFVCEGSF